MPDKKIDIGPVGEQLAKNIATVRGAKRLQFKELSELMSAAGRPIPPLGLRRIEARQRRVDAQDLATLASVLGFSVEQLLFTDIQVRAEYTLVT